MLIRFLFIFICLCATSSFATFEVIRPDAIGDLDQWDSTGSGNTKTIMLTDQTDANYIFAPNPSGDVDRYTLGDMVATDVDVVDSIVVYYTGQDNGSGNTKIQLAIRIGTDETTVNTVNLSTS